MFGVASGRWAAPRSERGLEGRALGLGAHDSPLPVSSSHALGNCADARLQVFKGLGGAESRVAQGDAQQQHSRRHEQGEVGVPALDEVQAGRVAGVMKPVIGALAAMPARVRRRWPQKGEDGEQDGNKAEGQQSPGGELPVSATLGLR